MNILDIVKHRYPFVMIDKVIESKYMESVVATKNVSYNEPWGVGHYPEKPIFPGVLMIEAMGQASGFLFVDNNKNAVEKNLFGQLAKVERVKFIKPVFPGDVITIKVKLENMINNYVIVSAKCYVEDEKVAEGKLSYVLKEVTYE